MCKIGFSLLLNTTSNMNNSQIRNIIQAFFDKKISKKTLYLFGKWFRLDENHDEKESILEEIWEKSPSVINEQTIDDFSKLKTIITNSELKRKTSIFRRIATYAAVISLIAVVSITLTYYFLIPKPLEYAQLSVSYGESKKLTLNDGTVVTVNAGSVLIYPKEFSASTRTVFLSGEANFSVAKNPAKPFIVKTKHIDITAFGTRFYIQSYPDAEYTKATLIEGKIKVDMESIKSESYILKPNNQLLYSHINNKVSIINIDANKLASWENGYLIFQEATFEEIVKAIERKYNVTINYDSKDLKKQSYNVRFNPNESLKEVMDILKLLINKSSYKIEGKVIYFYIY